MDHAGTRRAGAKTGFPKRGEIWLVALDPTIGHEIKKTRPAVIIQNEIGNEFLSTTIVAPITSKVRLPLSPAHVLIAAGDPAGLDMPSMALCDQIRTVDKRRLQKNIGAVGNQALLQVNDAIKISVGLN